MPFIPPLQGSGGRSRPHPQGVALGFPTTAPSGLHTTSVIVRPSCIRGQGRSFDAVSGWCSAEATPADWRQIMDVNVMGPALVTKHVVPAMRRTGGGAIVNLGSISSFIAQPEFWTYNASKAAVATMTRCMALDLAPDHIRVNAV